jgi:DNA-nicking Smr family endonuclease
LRSGSVEPDRVVDLHGHSLDRAWDAIDRALERSIAAGDRVLLLITGHER